MELEPAQALALAQFVKRVGWSEIRQNAVDDDEAYAMREALIFGKSFGGIWLCPALTSCTPKPPSPSAGDARPRPKLRRWPTTRPTTRSACRGIAGTMSNALTRAAHGLTLAENASWPLPSRRDSRRVLPPGEVPRTRITAMEYAETFEVDLDTAYDQLQEAAKQLYKRSITFYEPAHKRNGKPLPPTMVQMRWVGSVKYQKGKAGWSWHGGRICLRHLIGLKAQFTTYQLQQFRAALGLLVETAGAADALSVHGKAEYTIEDFKASMDAPPSLSDFGQVKRRIIDPAVKELTEKDGWLIQWVPVKAGRKVKALRFTFMRDLQGRLEL